MREETAFNLLRILANLGNGDYHKGEEVILKLHNRLIHARNSHQWGNGNEIDSPLKAQLALEGEFHEFAHALIAESTERQEDEALDVLAVGIRCLNREWE